MAESPSDRNQDEPATPDGDGGAGGADRPGRPELTERDGAEQASPGPDAPDPAASGGSEPGGQDSSQPGQATPDTNEYGQYEEDWQESEANAEDSDEDYWPDHEQDEDGQDYEYGQGDEDYNPDEYESEYEDDDEYEYDDDDEEEEEDDDEDEEDDGEKKMTLVEHLDELRTRIIRALLGLLIGMALALALSPQAIEAINRPYFDAVGKVPLVYDDMISVFTLYLRISLYMGIIIASPWIFYQLWMFISAGLYKHERKYITYAVPFSAALFIAGAMFFLFYISPMILKAFYLFNMWFGQGQLQALVKIDNHVTFMTNMMMVFGFCFQMPIAVLLLGKMGLVTVKSLARYRKYVIVGILILAAFVTSPSPLDQIALAIPMWLLFELGVLLVYLLVERKRRAEDAAMGYTDLDED